MKTPADRLKERREQLGYDTAAAAARAFGWPAATYRGHENGNRGLSEAAEIYARAFGVSLDWLLTGLDRGHAFTPTIHGLAIRYIPVVTLAELGLAIGGKIMLSTHTHIPVATEKELGTGPLAVPVADDSMTARGGNGVSFAKGSKVIINPDMQPMPGEFCYAEVAGEALPVFRKFTKETSDVIRLVALNPDYPSYWISADKPGRILGRAMIALTEL